MIRRVVRLNWSLRFFRGCQAIGLLEKIPEPLLQTFSEKAPPDTLLFNPSLAAGGSFSKCSIARRAYADASIAYFSTLCLLPHDRFFAARLGGLARQGRELQDSSDSNEPTSLLRRTRGEKMTISPAMESSPPLNDLAPSTGPRARSSTCARMTIRGPLASPTRRTVEVTGEKYCASWRCIGTP